MRRFRFGSAAIAIGLMAVFACGGGSSGGGNKGTIRIGASLPLSGASASDGQPTLNGVKYAVTKQGGSTDGFTLEVVPKDYAPAGTIDVNVAKTGMRDLVGDTAVLAVIGAFNSSATKQELPVANQAHLVMDSPANTNDCLTVHQAACDIPQVGYTPESLRPYGPNNYFRVAGKDSYQGGSMADYAYNTLGVKTVGVLNDETSYGVGIAEYFAERFCKDGGTVVGGCTLGSTGTAGVKFVPPTTTSYAATLSSLKSGGAQAIYFGGNASNKVCVSRNQSGGIFTIPSSQWLTGDGDVDSECLDSAGAQSDGMIGTTAAEDASKLGPDAKTVIDGVKSAYGTGPTGFGAYTIPAFAATQTVIAAIHKAIQDNGGNKPTREQVRVAMSNLSPVSTPLGSVKYDKAGDTTVQIIAFYKAVAGPSPSGSVLTCATNKSWCWLFIQSKNYAGQTYP